MGTLVARPSVADATSQIERGFFGDQQNAVAAGAFRSAKVIRYRLRRVASELDGSSSNLRDVPSHTPICPDTSSTMKGLCGVATTPL